MNERKVQLEYEGVSSPGSNLSLFLETQRRQSPSLLYKK